MPCIPCIPCIPLRRFSPMEGGLFKMAPRGSHYSKDAPIALERVAELVRRAAQDSGIKKNVGDKS